MGRGKAVTEGIQRSGGVARCWTVLHRFMTVSARTVARCSGNGGCTVIEYR